MTRIPSLQSGRSRGFSLIELLITVSVAAVLLAIAVPNFRTLIVSNALTSAANDLVGAMNLARMEAIKLNTNAQFCGNTAASNGSDTLGGACGTLSGAVVRLQNDGTATTVRDAAMGIQGQVQLASAGITAVRYGGQGLGFKATDTTKAPYSGTVAVLCSKMISTRNVRTISIATGSIITVATSNGTCP